MIAEHFADLEAATSTARACELLGASRATHYRRRRPPVLGPRPPRPSPPNALGQAEREHIVSVLRSQEYCDLAPAQIWARLLEPGGSVREEPVTHCRVCRHLCRCFPTMVAVDYSRPLEAVIPGTTGKVLGVLARTYAELPIRRVAQLGGVSRDRASIEIRRLVVLGIVSRREVAGASLVKLERTNVAAVALLALADARSTAISRLGELAKSIEPAPASLALFGSFARGTDDAESDLDVLAVRSDEVEPDDPPWLDSFGNWQDLARVVVGNPVNVIETSRHELHALTRTRSFWRAIVNDAITLAGEEPSQIVAPVGDRATIVSQAVESSPAEWLPAHKPGVHTPKPIARATTARAVRAEASERTAAVPNVRTAAVPVVRKATASSPKRTRRAR